MTSTVTYRKEKDKLVIDIAPKFKNIVFFGLAIEGFLYIFSGIIVFGLLMFLVFSKFRLDMLPALILLGGFSFLYILLGRKFLSVVADGETLICDKEDLLIRTGQNKKYYKVADISHLAIAGQGTITNHPLHNNFIDYTGLQTQEKEVNFLLTDGTISFFHNGHTVRFGKHVDMEDATQIISRLTRHTQNDLTLDDKTEAFNKQYDV